MANRRARIIDEHNNVIDHTGNGGNVIQLKIMYI